MVFENEDSGALNRPNMDPQTFSSPWVATTAAAYLAAVAGRKLGVGKYIADNIDLTKIQGIAGSAINTGRNIFREGQVEAMVAVSGPGARSKAMSRANRLGEHDDLGLFTALDEVLTTRERLQRMAPGAQADDLVGQVDAQTRMVIQEQFEAKSRGGYDALTVDDVLEMDPEVAKKMFGERGLGLIKAGMDKGLLEGSASLGQGVYKGQNGAVLRTDMATVGSVAKGIKAVANEFQIPFLGIKFGDLFGAPIQHLAGGSKNTMRLVQGVDDASQSSLLIGKKLFSIEKGANTNAEDLLGLRFIDDNMSVGNGSIGMGVAARRGNLPGQADSLSPEALIPDPAASPFKTLWSGVVEGFYGISRKQQTSHSMWERLKLAYKRRMDGELVADEAVHLRESGIRGSIDDALDRATGGSAGPGQVNNRIVDTPELSVVDRIKATLGFSVKGHKYVDSAGDEIAPRRLTGSSPVGPKAPALPNENILKDGVPQAHTNIDSFVFKDELGSKAKDLVHFGVNRLNDLFGWTFGIGMKPGRNTVLAATRAGFAFSGLAAGASIVGYADYLAGRTVEGLTAGGIDANDAKPSNIMLGAYAGARSLLQDVREMTGITDIARRAEEVAPGIISSDLSNVARWGAGPLAGLLAKSRVGFAAGAAASVLLGDDFTGTISDSAQDVRDVLSGEKEVAMRKGRYWEFGKQAYSGGQIGYFTQGFVARKRANYKMTSTLYGSEEEYYGHETWMPTPTNMFGLRKLFSGSKLEDRHALNRPYPGRSSAATDRALDQFYGKRGGFQQKVAAVQGDFEANARGATRLGIDMLSVDNNRGTFNRDVVEGIVPVMGMMSQSIRNQIDYRTEQFGIYRWLTESAGKLLFGNEQVSKELASADFMSDMGRAYYDEQLGGLLTLSELPRRFMPSSQIRRQRQAYNPLPNLMPDWLPGTRAQEERDQKYPINFHTGDAYGKIKHGEMRLPGEAYERMHRLHSGTPGVYDAMDRYLMLSDISPGSESHKHYKAIVDGWVKAGALDSYWQKKFQTAESQAAAKLQVHDFKPRPSDGMSITGDASGIEKITGFLWEGLSREVIPRVAAAVPMLGNFVEDKLLATRDAQETYLNREIYDTDEYDWAKPYETMIRPMVDGIVAKDPVTATVAGGTTAWMFAANPASRVLAGIAGALFTGTNSTMRAVGTQRLTNGYIPDHVKERREVDEYFDKIEYMKYKRLQQGAQSMRNMEAAERYRDLASRTVAGIDYNLGLEQFKRAAMKALPSRERAYLNEFFDAKEEDREDILAYLPDHIKPIYEAAYAKQGDKRFEGRHRELQQGTNESRILNYLKRTGKSAPTRDWAGWNPNVDFDAIKYETSMAMGNSVAADLHRQNLTFTRWDPVKMGQVAALDLDITSHFEGAVGLDPAQMFSLEAELRSVGMYDVHIDNGVGVGDNQFNYDLRDTRSDDIRAAFGRL